MLRFNPPAARVLQSLNPSRRPDLISRAGPGAVAEQFLRPKNATFFFSTRNVLAANMKRSTPSSGTKAAPKAKRPRVEVPEYHLTPSMRDEDGEVIWPAPRDQIENARSMIREWYAH